MRGITLRLQMKLLFVHVLLTVFSSTLFSRDITTLSGKTYNDATVVESNATKLVISYKDSGRSMLKSVPFTDLPDDIRIEFKDPLKAEAQTQTGLKNQEMETNLPKRTGAVPAQAPEMQKVPVEQEEQKPERSRPLNPNIELVDFVQNATGGNRSVQHPKGSRISSTLFVTSQHVNYETKWKLGFGGSFLCRIVELAGYKEDQKIYTLQRSSEVMVKVPNAGSWQWKISIDGSGFNSPVTIVELWMNNELLIRNLRGKSTPDEAIVLRYLPALGHGFKGEAIQPQQIDAVSATNTAANPESSQPVGGTQTLQSGWNKCPWCAGKGRNGSDDANLGNGVLRCKRCGGSGQVKVE